MSNDINKHEESGKINSLLDAMLINPKDNSVSCNIGKVVSFKTQEQKKRDNITKAIIKNTKSF
jgi:trehalose-6-phosphate synthase